MVQPKDDTTKRISFLTRSLRTKMRLSEWALNIERAASAFWPVFIVLFGVLGLLFWQAHTLLPNFISICVYAVLFGAVVYFVIKGIRRFTLAKREEAITRLDANAAGNPVSTISDKQFVGVKDAGSQALWRLHQERMLQKAEKVAVAKPTVRLSKNDPWAVRLIVLLFFVTAVFFGRAQSNQTLIETLQEIASGTTESAVSFEAWAEPPAYTGFPSLYLNELQEKGTLELPQGTELVLRSYGTSELGIETDVADLSEDQQVLSEESVFRVSQSGSLVLKKGFRTVGSWDIEMIPDLPPSVELTGEVSRTIQGSLQIPYLAKDDYGVTGGLVEITLEMDKLDRRYGLALEPEKTEAITFELPLPFNAETTNIEETIVEDLAKHPWAGLPVKIVLNVVDAEGNIAAIEPVYMPMPGKRFFDSLASALAEQRRDVLWNRINIDKVDMILKALTYLPEDGFQNQRAYLMVRSVIRRLGYDDTRPINDDTLEDVAETLWRAALLIEDGDLSDAAQRLKRAQERLSEAMENGATDEEIAELMDELREATDEYLRELAENAKPREQNAENENARQISPDELQQMMDRIQELMEQGRMDEAQQLLNQLQQMMENMEVTQGNQQQNGQGEQGGEGFQDTLRQQQELADENFQQMQEEFNRNQDGQQGEGQQREGEQQGQNDGPQDNDMQGNDRIGPQNGQSELADRQEALREMMDQQMRALGDDQSEAGQHARESLQRAEREMGAARDNLEKGLGSDALDNQANAVEALRDGMRQLNEANEQAQQGQNRNGQQNETAGPDSKDPLGRSTARRGQAPNSSENMLGSDAQLRRSREILEEIRRRSGERTRPQLELDYLDRLLDRF